MAPRTQHLLYGPYSSQTDTMCQMQSCFRPWTGWASNSSSQVSFLHLARVSPPAYTRRKHVSQLVMSPRATMFARVGSYTLYSPLIPSSLDNPSHLAFLFQYSPPRKAWAQSCWRPLSSFQDRTINTTKTPSVTSQLSDFVAANMTVRISGRAIAYQASSPIEDQRCLISSLFIC